MAVDKKVWWFIGGVLGLLGLSQIAKVSSLPTKVLIDLSYSWQGLSLVVTATIKNPVGQSIAVKYPFVKVAFQGNVIGSNNPSADMVVIPANGTQRIAIPIGFNLVNLLVSAPDVYYSYTQKTKVKLDIIVETGIQTALGVQEFTKTDTYSSIVGINGK